MNLSSGCSPAPETFENLRTTHAAITGWLNFNNYTHENIDQHPALMKIRKRLAVIQHEYDVFVQHTDFVGSIGQLALDALYHTATNPEADERFRNPARLILGLPLDVSLMDGPHNDLAEPREVMVPVNDWSNQVIVVPRETEEILIVEPKQYLDISF